MVVRAPQHVGQRVAEAMVDRPVRVELRAAADGVVVGAARHPAVTDREDLLHAPPAIPPEAAQRRGVVREGQRAPLEDVRLALGDLAVRAGGGPVLARPGPAVLEDAERAVAHARDFLFELTHLEQVVVVVRQRPARGIVGLEVLGAVDADAVRSHVHAPALHLEHDGAHHRVLLVHVLAVHVRPPEEGGGEDRQRLVVGVAVHQVEDQHHRAVREGVQRDRQVDQLVGPRAREQGGVGRAHADERDVVPPVVDVGSTQRHPHLVPGVGVGRVAWPGDAVRRGHGRPRSVTGLALDRRLERQRLNRVVLGEAALEGRERLAGGDLGRHAPNHAREVGDGAALRGTGDVQLEHVDRGREARHAVRGRRADGRRRRRSQTLEVSRVGASVVHHGDVVDLGRREGAEGVRRAERVGADRPGAVLVGEGQRVQRSQTRARADRQAAHGGPEEAPVALERHSQAREAGDGWRRRRIDHVARHVQLEAHALVRHPPIVQIVRPEAELDALAGLASHHVGAESPRSGARGREGVGGCRVASGLVAARPGRQRTARVVVATHHVGAHGVPPVRRRPTIATRSRSRKPMRAGVSGSAPSG